MLTGWHTIKGPLTRLVKTHQTRRFQAMLEEYPPPTPASLRVPAYNNLESVEGVMVGVLPASIFLKVCSTLFAVDRCLR